MASREVHRQGWGGLAGFVEAIPKFGCGRFSVYDEQDSYGTIKAKN
jgi:hypothetical protein